MGRYQNSSVLRGGGPLLMWQVSYRLGCPLVRVRGELDHAATDLLREVIDKELGEPVSALLLDFSELAYMDSGGLALMFETLRRLKEPAWLGVIDGNPTVTRLMEITGLLDHPRVRALPDLDAAQAALAV
jgi:anti-anti-sigma factor